MPETTSIHIPAIPSTPAASTAQNHFLRLSGTNELVFLEIQGSIARLDREEKKMGRLVQDDDGRIYLFVGYQKMEGKLVELKAPFAVLRRKRAASRLHATEIAASDRAADEDMQDGNGQESGEVEMEVVDVCRKKIYFGIRPEPLNDMEV